MCGIAGFFVCLTRPRQRRGLLARMIGALRIADRTARASTSTATSAWRTRGSASSTSAAASSRCANDDGTVWITFNGEIFNYVELRDELIARGHTLPHRRPTPRSSSTSTRRWGRTASSAERRLRLRDLGRAPPPADAGARPHGRAAAVLRAARRRALFRLRGEGAARRCRASSAELDPIALDQIFTFWFPLAPRTIFKDISELPPAHVLIADADRRHDAAATGSLDYPDAADDRRRRQRERGARSPRRCARC